MLRPWTALALLALVACTKGGSEDGRTSKEPAPVPASPSSAAPAASAATDAGAPGEVIAGKAASYAGKYTVAPATMYVPAAKDWSSVKFKNEESKHVGEGTFTFTVDPSGRLAGASEGGPLGSAILEGILEGPHVAATIRRKDAADEGLWGTLVGKVSGDAIEGTMKLSEWNAAVVREAKFTAEVSK